MLVQQPLADEEPQPEKNGIVGLLVILSAAAAAGIEARLLDHI